MIVRYTDTLSTGGSASVRGCSARNTETQAVDMNDDGANKVNLLF